MSGVIIRRFPRNHGDKRTVVRLLAKFHRAVRQSKQGVVLAGADVLAWVSCRADARECYRQCIADRQRFY